MYIYIFYAQAKIRNEEHHMRIGTRHDAAAAVKTGTVQGPTLTYLKGTQVQSGSCIRQC